MREGEGGGLTHREEMYARKGGKRAQLLGLNEKREEGEKSIS